MAARARLLALALLLGSGLVPPGAAWAGPTREAASPADDLPVRTIDAAGLPRGRDARIDHLQDGVLHTATGRAIPIRTPVTKDQRQLLGASREGWLVAVRRGTSSRVIVVRPGRRPTDVPRTRARSYGNTSVSWRASRDGEMLISTSYDRGGSSVLVRDLAGTLVGSRAGSYSTPLDADAGHVVTSGENGSGRRRVYDWVPRTSLTEITASATYVSLREDLMFARTEGRLYGPSPISVPVAPRWAAPFQPLAISPDGATAVGLRVARSIFNSPAILDVRRMDDGTLLDAISFGPRITQKTWFLGKDHEQTARWESSRAFVLQLATPQGDVLVRCRLGGTCQRASEYGGDITTAHESFMWW